jgi:FtsP/CotA-like multicopper oxidase with cupredoxin domain
LRVIFATRIGAQAAVVALLCTSAFVPNASVASAPHATHEQAPCSGPLLSGAIEEPPQIEVSSLPLDDAGTHELILRVVRQGDRFCYRYTLSGVEQRRAPTLRVRRGQTFAIRLVNELRAPAPGATMAASALTPCKPGMMPAASSEMFPGYMNRMAVARPMAMKDADVNLHMHGFQGPEAQENIFASTLSTPAHACEIVMTIPLTQPPGTYFYHAHAHGAADDETAGGLSGMWIVEADTPQLPLADDHALLIKYRVPYVATDNFVTDLTPLDVKGARDIMAASSASPVPFDPFNPPPWRSGVPTSDGRGTLLDSCGSRSGVELTVDHSGAPGTLTVPSGKRQLLRLLNATADSPIFLRMRDEAGAPAPMHVVGLDGTPVGGNAAQPLSQYVAMNEVTLPPAGRADVLVTLSPGQAMTLYDAITCEAPADEVSIPTDLLVVRAGPPDAASAAASGVAISQPLDPTQSPAARLVAYAHAHPQQVRRRAFTYTEYVVPHGHGLAAAYFITETSATNFRELPYWPVYPKGALAPLPNVVVKRGTIEEWDLFNASAETHSFHIHQMTFVAVDAKPGPATLDTVMIPFGKFLPNKKNSNYPLIAPSRTRILLDFRHVMPGTFVFHCHMLFHEDRGMMGVVKVV